MHSYIRPDHTAEPRRLPENDYAISRGRRSTESFNDVCRSVAADGQLS